MSFRIFDLEPIYSRFAESDDFPTVTVNGITVALCHPNASYYPRAIVDNEYWEDPLAYAYSIAAQTDFGFPLIAPEKDVPSHEKLAIQLAMIRHDLLPVEGYIAAYTRIYIMAHASTFPRNRLRETVGLDDFDYFILDLAEKKVNYIVSQDRYVIDIADDTELGTWCLVEDTVGRGNAYSGQNEDCISWLIEPPFLNTDPANEIEVTIEADDEFRRRVRSHMMARLRLAGYLTE